MAYVAAADLAQATGVQRVAPNVGADADQSCSGELWLFNPSSTTYIKHFIIRTSTVRSDNIVFDTFLGSGSTLIACEKTNRVCYGMELDEHYCDVIINRWEQFTGKKAELING